MTAPLVLDHPRRVALLAGELVANRLRARPGMRLILPAGHTPLEMYAALRAHAADGSLPAAQATVFQLDEQLGLGPDDEGSSRAYLRRELHGVGFGAVHWLDGAAADAGAEVARHRALLDAAPVDLAVLGLTPDGRVTHSPLAVGLPTLLNVRELLMLVCGEAKARALLAMLEGPPQASCPASLLRDHPRLTVACDAAAAGLLRRRPGWSSDHAVIVLGHREPGISAGDRVSDESWARLRRAREVCRDDPPRTVILTGYSRTPDGLSEAEQMKAEWSDADVPALLEDAGRDTAENASRSLPLVRALGDVRRVTVVTSGWHVRAPYFFAPYRALGIRLSFAWTLHGPWPRMLVHELRSARWMRGARRRAMAAMRLPAQAP